MLAIWGARKIEFWPSLIKDFVKREILHRDKRKKVSVTKHGCDKQWQFEHWILDSDKVVTTFQLHLEQHRFTRYVPLRWAGLKNFHRNRSHDQVIYALEVDSSNRRSLWTFQTIQRIENYIFIPELRTLERIKLFWDHNLGAFSVAILFITDTFFLSSCNFCPFSV